MPVQKLTDHTVRGPILPTPVRSLQGVSGGPVPESCLRYSNDPTLYGYMLNNYLGDCVVAAVAHCVQIQAQVQTVALNTASSGDTDPHNAWVPRDSDIKNIYEYASAPHTKASGEFFNGVEVWGADIHKVFAKLSAGGWDGTKRHCAWGRPQPNSRQRLMELIYYTGAAYATCGLPISATKQRYYRVTSGPDAVVGSYGFHGIAAVGYNANGVEILNWGKLVSVSWAWWDKYVISANRQDGTQHSGSGELWSVVSFDWATGGIAQATGQSWASIYKRFA